MRHHWKHHAVFHWIPYQGLQVGSCPRRNPCSKSWPKFWGHLALPGFKGWPSIFGSFHRVLGAIHLRSVEGCFDCLEHSWLSKAQGNGASCRLIGIWWSTRARHCCASIGCEGPIWRFYCQGDWLQPFWPSPERTCQYSAWVFPWPRWLWTGHFSAIIFLSYLSQMRPQWSISSARCWYRSELWI